MEGIEFQVLSAVSSPVAGNLLFWEESCAVSTRKSIELLS